jgi:hypothetical protein
MIVIEYDNVMVKELDAGPFNHDNTITITVLLACADTWGRERQEGGSLAMS